jgi:membrane protein implicated in regulation of membrane protease activity
MDSNEIKKGIIRAVAYIIGVALLLLFIYKIQSVILYITKSLDKVFWKRFISSKKIIYSEY